MFQINQSSCVTHVRFRRWSRKKYAIFSSLSQNVTIGKVCSSICDLSLRKSSSISAKKNINTITEKELDENEDELEKYNENILQCGTFSIFEIINRTLSITSVPAIFTYYFIN